MSQQVIGKKVLKLIQRYPLNKIRRILNDEPSQAFHNKRFGEFDAMVAESMLTDTQRNQVYADLLALKQLGVKLRDPAPISWSMLMKFAPIKMKKEILEEVKKLEQQKQQAQAKAEKAQGIQQMLEIELAKGNVLGNRAIAEERRAQAVENTTDAALNRAEVMEKLADMKVGRFLEFINAAIGLETIGQQNESAEAKS